MGAARPSRAVPFRPVATGFGEAYFGRMPATRLLRILTLCAMLFASFSMASGGHAAKAAPVPAAMQAMPAHGGGHCTGGEEQRSTPDSPSIDCLIACAGLPTIMPAFDHAPALTAELPAIPLERRVSGRNPEDELPPPRNA